MQPLLFRPLLKRIRWGGTRLGTRLGKPIGEARDAAESWELVDREQEQSVVLDGDLAGRTLRELLQQSPREILGGAGGARFPLLLKFLDATDRLSLQVHPNDEQALAFDPQEQGKNEAWVILDAEPESRLWLGLKRGVGRSELLAALDHERLDDVVHVCRPRPGDCYFVPAGTVHAIGEGILLAEVQQCSDLTFRLHDWGRLGADGQPRPLHLEESLACIDFSRGPVDAVVPLRRRVDAVEYDELIRSPWFGIDRYTTDRPVRLAPRDEFRVLMLLTGELAVGGEGFSRRLTRGTTLLIPASCGEVSLAPRGAATWLEITGPPHAI